MKKICQIYLAILLIIAFGGMIAELRSEYSMERILWGINNDFEKINNPKNAENEYIVKKILARYYHFIRKHSKSALVPEAKLGLANTLIELGRFDEGREIYNEIIKNYTINTNIVAQSQQALGKSYELENNWPRAVTIYRAIVREFPLTPTGFSIPYYLGEFYSSRGLNSTAISALNEAVEFYENIFANYPDSPLGFSSLQMLVKCHLALAKWPEAYYSAKRLLFEYPLAPSLVDTIYIMQDISIKKLKNPQLAVKTYNEFLKKNPGHPIRPTLQKIIKKLTSESQ